MNAIIRIAYGSKLEIIWGTRWNGRISENIFGSAVGKENWFKK